MPEEWPLRKASVAWWRATSDEDDGCIAIDALIGDSVAALNVLSQVFAATDRHSVEKLFRGMFY